MRNDEIRISRPMVKLLEGVTVKVEYTPLRIASSGIELAEDITVHIGGPDGLMLWGLPMVVARLLHEAAEGLEAAMPKEDAA